MMHLLEQARAWLTAINPALPAVVLIFAIWAPQAAIRKWLPALWEWPASKGPKIRELRRVWQALPSLTAGALVTALSAKLDPWQAVTGVAIGAVAPFWHHALRALPFIPYQGELGGKPKPRKPDDDTTPRDGTKAVGMMTIALGCLVLVRCGLFGGGASAPDSCSFENAAYSAKVLECDQKIGECPKREDGTPQEDCPALVECERWLAEVCQ